MSIFFAAMVAAADTPASPVQSKASETNVAAARAPGHATDVELGFKTMHVTAVLGKNNQPAAGAKFKVRYNWKSKQYNAFYTTSENGSVDVEVPIHRNIFNVSLEATPEKHVPVYFGWENRNRAITPLPDNLAVRFEPGETKSVQLVAIAGNRVIRGGINYANGPVTEETRKQLA
jgi:hypothetical protein